MKIKSGFQLRKFCNENIVVACGLNHMNFSKIIRLNESAAYLWQAIQGKDFDASMLAQLLCDEYEVDADTAAHDAQQLMDDWTQAGLTE